MSVHYTLSSPVTVGDLTRQVNLTAFKVTSISINFEDAYTSSGEAIVSICLADVVTGYPLNFVYRDASALALAQVIEGQIGPEILLKLANEGKLPAGKVATV